MSSECTYNAQCSTDDTFRTTKLTAHEQRERAGYANGGGAPVKSSAFFEVIGGFLYRKKLEKGFIQYREVLAEDKRLQSIATFHEKKQGKSHHTLEDTYRLVAEHYWWEGMYFQVRDFVLSCEECQSKRSESSDVGLISRMVESQSHQILSKLNSQREAGLFCDITLKTGGGHSFVAHKAVLAAVSEYFQELFTEMDLATDPQSHVDLTGFNEQSLLALLEFSYTSTLNLNLDSLTEVCAMARHLRMWPALEACSAIKKEQETCQPCSKMHSTAGDPNSIPGPFRRDHSLTPQRKVGLKRMREDEPECGSGSSWNTQVQYREHIVDKMSDESGTEIFNPQLQCQASSSFHVEENGFPCSPNRRMKLMDFKSPSCKKKLSSRPIPSAIPSSPCTSTRSSSPSRRLLRSSPGAALALRRLLPKIDLTTKRKRKSPSYRTYKSRSEFSVTPSQSQASHVTSVMVKEEDQEEEVCNTIPQDEVHSPRAQEKYKLLSFLGLQRKSLVPGPEELSGWGQKKRLRKSKVSNYSLTARRKPRSQGVTLAIGPSLGALAAVSPSLSLCDMSRMDLLNRPLKAEPQDSWSHESSRKKRRGPAGQAVQPSTRTTRSKSLLQADSSGADRPLRRHNRNQDQKTQPQPARRGRVPAHNAYSTSKRMLRIKQEPADSAILQPIQRRNTVYHHQATVNPPKETGPPRRGRPPADRTVRATTNLQQRKQYKIGRPAAEKPKSSKQLESKTKYNYATGMAQAKHSRTKRGTQVKENRKSKELANRKENSEVQYGVMNWDISNTNHQHLHSHPLYKTIKEEPADPLPLTQPFPTSDSSDLGKRQSKPPVKLLDQGFLFGFCRPASGIKQEEESVDIYLTRSVSNASSSHRDSSPNLVKRERVRARIKPDRTGLNGPHWAGLGNRSTPFSQRLAIQVKTERDESQRSSVVKVARHPKVSKRSCKVKKEPTKTKNVNKLLPLSSRRSILLESIRRARLKRLQDPKGQGSSGTHVCLQCRASYRDCDALIMHRIRHIEGKHWPCPLCSKTFFRQRNVRNHIRTHNPKLYKCRQCIAAH